MSEREGGKSMNFYGIFNYTDRRPRDRGNKREELVNSVICYWMQREAFPALSFSLSLFRS